MTHKTKGIVLRTVKFGETSIVVTMLTELFGLQSYMVNGVRTISKKGSSKSIFFQPAAILDMEAYHNEFKNLQRIKEFRWGYLYEHLFSDVIKNSVALFMVELVTKCLKQPEANADLFYFTEDSLQHLDKANNIVTANFPLFFSLHLAVFFGFRISDAYSSLNPYLDLEEGRFVSEQPMHAFYLADKEAQAVSTILKMMQPAELEQLHLNQDVRRRLTSSIEKYYALHVPEFGSLKTLTVLKEVMN
ncbi:MAG TPA: DNA repair protein RecO [Flavisolibacter sp.]|nr:DNA repair protein RecO [Flavisolibacter sp.]